MTAAFFSSSNTDTTNLHFIHHPCLYSEKSECLKCLKKCSSLFPFFEFNPLLTRKVVLSRILCTLKSVCVRSLHGFVFLNLSIGVCVCVDIHSAQWLPAQSQSSPGLNKSSVLHREGAGSVSAQQDGSIQM